MGSFLQRFPGRGLLTRASTPGPGSVSRREEESYGIRRAKTPGPLPASPSPEVDYLPPPLPPPLVRESAFEPGGRLNTSEREAWDIIRAPLAARGIYIPFADFWENWPAHIYHQSPDVILVKQQTLDNKLEDVYLKIVPKPSQELSIVKYLSHPLRRAKSTIACSPVGDFIEPSSLPTCAVYTMPPLLPLSPDDLITLADVLDFVRQMLDGLSFLHSRGIVHRDISSKNIMILPPNTGNRLPQQWVPEGRHVHYCFIDFGLSVYFAKGRERLLRDGSGRLSTAPEVHDFRAAPDGKGYDPFPVDIWCLGETIRGRLILGREHVEALAPLVSRMNDDDPMKRPTASGAARELAHIIEQLHPDQLKQRTLAETWTELRARQGQTKSITGKSSNRRHFPRFRV